MTEPWLKPPKMMPCHIVVECQKWRCSNHHSTPASKPSLAAIEMSLAQIRHTYLCLKSFIMTELWPKQPKMMPSHITVECQKWRWSKHHSTPANKPSLIATGMSFTQIKHTYPSLTAFIISELWLKEPKMLPSHIVVECRNWRWSNQQSTSANKSSLIGVGMSLAQTRHTYPGLTAFIMTELWLTQPKMLPSHITAECQKWRCSNHHNTPGKNTFPVRCRNEFGSNKTYLFMVNSFYYHWALAEAAKNAARPHYCWMPKMKVLPPPQNSNKNTFPDKYRS